LSDIENESLSERAFAAELEDQIPALLGITPRSPSEAVSGEEEVVVSDEPPSAPAAESVPATEPGEPEAVPATEEEEEGEPESAEEESLAWARRKYGEDVTLERIAKAAFDQEQMVSRLGTKAKENESLAAEWYQYAQNLERQLQAQPTGMPLSSSEEQWIENSITNPLAHAVQAKMSGNEVLYRAVISRISQEDPLVAGQVASYAEMAFAEQVRAQQANAAAAENGQSGEQEIGASIRRLGIDLDKYGKPMMEKIGDMGEYHPYTQAILYGSEAERDLAFQAVYDLVREGRVMRREVRDTEREEQIKREGELRRKAAGVLTGAPHVSAVKQSPFMEAMENEWRRAGQWSDE
jgi:hypothetical protein